MAGITQTVSDYARKLGNALLNQGGSTDATAATQEAYKQHQLEAAQNGQPPIPYADFVRQYRPQPTPPQ